MQFKSERFWSNTSAKSFAASTVATLLLLGLFSRPGLATITVTAISKLNGNTLGNAQDGSYYYPYDYTTARQTNFGKRSTATPTPIPSFGVIDPAVTFVDLGRDPDPTTGTTASDPGTIFFNIQSDNTSFPTQPVVVATLANSTTSSTLDLVPIISVNGGFCNTSSCVIGYGPQVNVAGSSYYFGANYGQGQVMTVGISPQAMCNSVFEVGAAAEGLGCDAYPFTNSAPVTAVTSPMTINFSIYAQQDVINALSVGGTPQVISSATPQDGPTAVPLLFESIGPQTVPSPNPTPTPQENCTFYDGMENAQQGGMQVDTSAAVFTINGDPAGSDPAQVIVVAAPSPAATLQSTAQTYLNNLPAGVATPVGASAVRPTVSGFQNSTDASNPYWYTVGFLVEDAAGFVFDPGASGSVCTFPYSFDTSNVQGFLQQSKCFIATAAFRSMDSAPLVLLRAFRDNFLEHFSLGQSFVRWYYGWSPDAAEWLIDHPIFRFPVLLALIPLQILAWMVLHPLLLLLLFMSSVMVFFLSLLRQSEVKIGRSTE